MKVECSAKVNSGGLAAYTDAGYEMSLARSSTGVKGHTWTFVAICLLSIVSSGMSLSLSGGPLPLGEWRMYKNPHLFSKQRHEFDSEQLQSPLKIISLFSFPVGWSRSPLEGKAEGTLHSYV